MAPNKMMRFYELSLTRRQPFGLIDLWLGCYFNLAGTSIMCFSFSMLLRLDKFLVCFALGT